MLQFVDSRLLAAIILLIGCAAAKCPAQNFNETSEFSLPLSGTVAGDSCVINITRSGNSSFTTLTLTNVVMGDNDTLVISDGNKTLMNLTKESGAVSKLTISFSPSTIVRYTASVNNTQSSGSVAFNLEECRHSLTDSWTVPVTTPHYTPGSGAFSCVYTVAAALPVGRVAVAHFLSYSLQNGSYVALTSGQNTDNTALVPRDFFTDPSANETTVEFTIANNTADQSFTLVFDNSITSCTKDLTINTTTVMNLTLPNLPEVGYTCHMRVASEGDNNTLMMRVDDAVFADGLDSLTVLDGSTSESALATHLSESTTDYLVLSTGSYLTLHLSLNSRPAARVLALSFIPVTGASHRLSGNGTLSHTAKPGNTSLTSDLATSDLATSDLVTSYWQLEAAAGSVVRVSLTSNLTANATLTYYNGLQRDENKVLAVLCASRQDLTVVVGGPDMLVVLEDLPATDNFTATFDSVRANCDQTLTSPSGQLHYVEEAGDVSDCCTWTLAPSMTQGVLVLTPQLLSLGPGDNITIYSGLKGETVLATFTSDLGLGPLPQVNIPAADGARVMIHDADTGKSDMKIDFNYRVDEQVCGGALSSAGVLTTPNFPNQYPVNSGCEWSAADSRQLFLSVDSVSLAPGHGVSVVSQGKELVRYDNTTTVLPPDFITKTNSTVVKFCAPGGSTPGVSQGAKVKYWLLDCGGLVNGTSGTISSPKLSTNQSAVCIWVVKLPSSNVSNIINFNTTISGNASQAVVDQRSCLQVYDGSSLRSTQLLHVANVSSPTRRQSRYDTIVVVYNHNVLDHTATFGFNLTFRSHKCNATCDNGVCLHADWRCNGVNDCGDFSDEKNCSAPIPPPSPTPAPLHPQDMSGWVAAGWVPGSLIIGMVLGAGLLVIVPRVYRRVRGTGGNYARMSDHTPVVA